MSGQTFVGRELRGLSQDPGSWLLIATVAIATCGLAIQSLSLPLALGLTLAATLLVAWGMGRVVDWLDGSEQSSITARGQTTGPSTGTSPSPASPSPSSRIPELVVSGPGRSVRLQCTRRSADDQMAFIVQCDQGITSVAVPLGPGDSVHDLPILRDSGASRWT